MITAVVFILAAALAIPTFGISLIVFLCAKVWWDRLSGQTIAKYVYLSHKNDGKPYELFRISGAAIRYFFSKFGDSISSYEFDAKSGAYVGRVNILEAGDLSVSVVRTRRCITIRAVKSPTMTLEGVKDVPFLDPFIAGDAIFTEAERKSIEAAEKAVKADWKALASQRAGKRSSDSNIDDDVPF